MEFKRRLKNVLPKDSVPLLLRVDSEGENLWVLSFFNAKEDKRSHLAKVHIADGKVLSRLDFPSTYTNLFIAENGDLRLTERFWLRAHNKPC